uniref:Cytoplasmic tRNA 2-thiolation protein 2 n=1 Tax=Stomoxys calcitrans TaxID=35570 RepID=A0A1I8NMV7_STOCA
MCSIGEDDFGDEGGAHAMIPDGKLITNLETPGDILCNKCKKPGATYKLTFREAECKECFLNYARHKFRAALGSSKILPRNANVVLVFNGSAQSVVLLDMLHHAQTQNTFKRLHCNATVIFIDDYWICHGVTSEGDYQNFIRNIKNILSTYCGFESFVLPLMGIDDAMSLIFNFKTLPDDYFVKVNSPSKDFIESLENIKSLTSRQDFVKHHRSRLIAEVARYFQCQFAFMSAISSDLAFDLLAAVALGRGASAALDVALVDNRLPNDVQIVRPLKDLTQEEIELYARAQELYLPLYQAYGDDGGSSASLQNLTKTFVEGLQRNYSSTVSTVFRTGSKISLNQDISLKMKDLSVLEDGLGLHCSFCKSFLDYKDSTTLLAIEFSRVVSEMGVTHNTAQDLNYKAHQYVSGVNEEGHMRNLCHACRNIYAEMLNKSHFL